MKIYDTHTAPTPRRVRIFLAEKGIDVEYVQVDLKSGENLSAEMRKKNPGGKIPFLELDDGTCIAESDAICLYFEELYPDTPKLLGNTPQEKAHIAMHQRQAEFGLFMQVGMCFQHSTDYFKDRMTPVKEYGAVCGTNVAKFLHMLNKRLADSEFVAGDAFSIADITVLCSIDFARVMDIRIQPDQTHLQRWYDAVSQRPTAKA